MAKKRDHKIIITNEAINKVPRVQYKEIPETEIGYLALHLERILSLELK